MALFSGLFMGIASIAVMTIAYRIYILKGDLAGNEPESFFCRMWKDSRLFHTIVWIAVFAFSFACGWFAIENVQNAIAYYRIAVAMFILLAATVTDVFTYRIPNLLTILCLIMGVIATIATAFMNKDEAVAWVVNSMLALIVSMLFLLLMSRVTKGGLGLGDVKIVSGFGFLCGLRATIYMLFIGFLICAMVSIVLLATKKKNLKDNLALGPYLWIGAGVATMLSLV